jgi:hypothetical protein
MVTDSPGVITNWGAGYLSFKSTAAAVSAHTKANQTWSSIGAVNVGTYGIQLGYGVAAESFEGYVLSSLCAQGTGANQLVYAAHSALVQSYDAPSKTWTVTLKRICNNNSAGDILVTETCITWQNQALGTLVMYNRDLLSPSQNVAVGAQVTTSYAVTLTYPA